MEKSNQAGFTLIEILMVVALLGIITAIAIPMYRNYTTTAKCQQVVGPVHSTMVAVVGDFAENGTAALDNVTSAGNPGTLNINGRIYKFPENVQIKFVRAAAPDNRYTVKGRRTDGITCKAAAYVLVEGETEGSWGAW